MRLSSSDNDVMKDTASIPDDVMQLSPSDNALLKDASSPPVDVMRLSEHMFHPGIPPFVGFDLTDDEKQEAVNVHNDFRRQEGAANMMFMVREIYTKMLVQYLCLLC